MTQGTELPGGYEQAPFAGRPESIEAFLGAVLTRLRGKPEQRILDLGSGTGDLALALAARLTSASITAIDISTANVALATDRAVASGVAGRVRFIAADYRQWATPPFDVIVSDSVLHLIPAADEVMAEKLARDLVPGGLLIATMPDTSLRNSALLVQRRLWRAMPRGFDGLALSLARRLHPSEAASVLADRIGYLRMLPERLHDPQFSAAMRSAGLDELEATPWPGASLLKLRHRLVVWHRSRE